MTHGMVNCTRNLKHVDEKKDLLIKLSSQDIIRNEKTEDQKIKFLLSLE